MLTVTNHKNYAGAYQVTDSLAHKCLATSTRIMPCERLSCVYILMKFTPFFLMIIQTKQLQLKTQVHGQWNDSCDGNQLHRSQASGKT